jgi:hypothetical protein
MCIFKKLWFICFATKEGITDRELKAMVDQLEAGQVDTDLSGGVLQGTEPVRGLENPGDIGLSCFSEAGSGRFFRYGFAKSAVIILTKKD